jgi:hypothetical protein
MVAGSVLCSHSPGRRFPETLVDYRQEIDQVEGLAEGFYSPAQEGYQAC